MLEFMPGSLSGVTSPPRSGSTTGATPLPEPGSLTGATPRPSPSPSPTSRAPAPSRAVRGTMISVAPAPCSIGRLLRTAIDVAQVGATRLHLAPDQEDIEAAVAGLRQHTSLVLTADPGAPAARLVDVIGSGLTEVVLDASDDAAELVAELARIAAAHPAGASVSGRGASAMPVLLVALAAGLHVRVGTADTPPEPRSADLRPNTALTARDDTALVARASGLARIAGRPPMDIETTRALLGLS